MSKLMLLNFCRKEVFSDVSSHYMTINLVHWFALL